MRYTSTRDHALSVTFEEAIFSGYAPDDGGLFVPETLPEVTVDNLKEWSSLTYPQLTLELLRMFIAKDEVPDDVLRSICVSAFEGFEDPERAVPVVKIGSLYVAELFHGPTFCFKDLGMRGLVNLLSYFSTLRDTRTTLLVATTGDTGPAAVQAVSDQNNPLLSILVHYPNGQISEFQRRQLTTIDSPFVRVAAFEGGGDDMDAPIKRILSSQDSTTPKQRICGVNSYNIARPLMQMVHYVWTYLRVVEQLGAEPGDPDVKVNVVIPTGAMGNIVGGYMAKKMGVPLGKLCAGTNINDITFRVMETGKFHKSERMERTLSEAINIQLPYNFERLLYYLTDCNDSLVREWMSRVDETSKLDLDAKWLKRLQDEFSSRRVTDEKMCQTTRMMKDTYDYVVDPHTAVAIAAAEMLGYYSPSDDQPTDSPVAILSTASPCKFQEAVTIALGNDGWNDYVAHHFPARAKEVMEKEEAEPVMYRKEQDWEAMARGIIHELG